MRHKTDKIKRRFQWGVFLINFFHTHTTSLAPSGCDSPPPPSKNTERNRPEMATKQKRSSLDTLKTLTLRPAASIKAKITNKYPREFQVAVLEGNMARCDKILGKGAVDINAADETGLTFLQCAAWKNRVDMIDMLMAHGAELEAKNLHGYTALHWAAWFDSFEAAESLVTLNANVWARDNDGKTPLEVALENNSDRVANIIRKAQSEIPEPLPAPVEKRPSLMDTMLRRKSRVSVSQAPATS
eukprot:m.114631 g.114631  ORF g.114631 m.114631 type:complete len:243 (+) comp16034_c0_seq1:108-836(+)